MIFDAHPPNIPLQISDKLLTPEINEPCTARYRLVLYIFYKRKFDKRMKKFNQLVLSLTVSIALTACGGSGGGGKSKSLLSAQRQYQLFRAVK